MEPLGSIDRGFLELHSPVGRQGSNMEDEDGVWERTACIQRNHQLYELRNSVFLSLHRKTRG